MAWEVYPTLFDGATLNWDLRINFHLVNFQPVVGQCHQKSQRIAVAVRTGSLLEFR